jgi:hypothetical protein
MTALKTLALVLSALCVILIQNPALADPYEDSDDDYEDSYYAGSDERTEFSITGGVAPPTGSLTDYHQVGFSFGGGVSYSLTPHLAINVVSVSYDRFGLDENQFRDDTGFDSSGASISMLSVMGGLRARFIPNGFSPFVAADAGLVHSSVEDLTIDGSTAFSGYSENDFGVSLGGGLEGPMNSTSSVFTEVRVNMAFTDGDTSTYVPVRAGMRFHF